MVRNTLGCGSISFTRDSARFQIQDMLTLKEKVIPFFDAFKLYGKKSYDYQLWKEALEILVTNRGLKEESHLKEENRRLELLRNKMKQYKSHLARPHKWSSLAV